MTNLNDYSRAQLEEAAKIAGLEIDGRWSDITLAAKLIEKGVTPASVDQASLFVDSGNDALSMFNKEEGDRAVVFMERGNASYRVMGHRFTKEHPYRVMTKSEANFIVNNEEGFRIVDPEIAARFYQR